MSINFRDKVVAAPRLQSWISTQTQDGKRHKRLARQRGLNFTLAMSGRRQKWSKPSLPSSVTSVESMCW